MMEKEARQFLRRMIKSGGFVAAGMSDSQPRLWRNNSSYSAGMINTNMLQYLQREKLVAKDRNGRLLVTDKGRKFAKPWCLRLF